MIAAALLASVMVTTQPVDPPLKLRVTLPVLVAGAALDLGTTEWALNQHGVREAGAGQTLTKRSLLKAGFVLAEAVVVRKAGRKWGKRTLIGLTVVQVGFGGWNVYQGRKARNYQR